MERKRSDGIDGAPALRGPPGGAAIRRPSVPDIELASDRIASPIDWRMIVTAGRADRASLDRPTRALLAALEAS